MDGSFAFEPHEAMGHLRPAIDRILDIQSQEGAIPWFEDGPWDPWNHTESAMALTVAGETEAAIGAFNYLMAAQRLDGAWLGEYGNALPMVDRDYISREPAPAFLDSNFCAYPAVGIAHYHLHSQDLERTKSWWPMVERALDFVVQLQRPNGTISWAFEAIGTDQDDALLAGNASIAKSLECGLFLAQICGFEKPVWVTALKKLRTALSQYPDYFDRRDTGARFAMDWYYPVLSGALTPTEQATRIENAYHRFMVEDRGCRCVADEPWVTVAETAELVIALVAANQRDQAERVFEVLCPYRDEVGVFWMGHQFAEDIFWPREQPSWTQAAVILAADALYGGTEASRLLTHALLTNVEASVGS